MGNRKQDKSRTYSKSEIQQWLITELASRMGISKGEIDRAEPFMNYGLDSAEAVMLSGDMEEWLGVDLSPTLVWDYPNIEELTNYLTQELKQDHGIRNEKEEESNNQSPLDEPNNPSPLDKSNKQSLLDQSNHPSPLEEEAYLDDIAIIGMGCRFPAAKGLEEYWKLLCEGANAVSTYPESRRKIVEPPSEKMSESKGGYITGVERFDYHFFQLSRREAEQMDPQQRILAEVSYEALEDAGQRVDKLRGSKTGVFIGISSSDYGRMHGEDHLELYATTGNAFSIAANRLSYFYDFRGPSMAIDTACSSSLVAVHLACQSIRQGESDLALAGGVNLMLTEDLTKSFTNAGMLSEDGSCKTFDAKANGYVRGEGAGVVVLKPLKQALKDGDDIYALIKGSAINQDGKSNGLTAPNRQSQIEVLNQAYENAKINPAEVQYIEAHGTGTPLGDPIEATALGNVLSMGRDPEHTCRLGSVKTNIGHLEAAAGIAGLMKVALSIKYQMIPPSLHFNEWNPYIPHQQLPFVVQRKLEKWQPASKRHIAGVSSFGFGGTNAHVVLTNAPSIIEESTLTASTQDSGDKKLFMLSAYDKNSLNVLSERYIQYMNLFNTSNKGLLDLCYTLGVRRNHLKHRLAILARTKEEIVQELKKYLEGQHSENLIQQIQGTEKKSKLAFVLSGQGTQWHAMGRDLYETNTIFRSAFDECDTLFKRYSTWSLMEEMMSDPETSRLHETEVAQPMIFSIQVALAELWSSYGITPDAVVGHSVGEVAAAYLAGSLTLEQAIEIVYYRSSFMQVTERGSMVSVGLTFEETQNLLAPYGDLVSVAAYNSPASCVLSGDCSKLNEIVDALQKKGVACKYLAVEYGFHSAKMDPILDQFAQKLSHIQPGKSHIPLYSTTLGQTCAGDEISATYWSKNVRNTVLFKTAIEQMINDGYSTFIEVGPHAVLTKPILECLEQDTMGNEGKVMPSMLRGENSYHVLLHSLANLHVSGRSVHVENIFSKGQKQLRQLPMYPWQHKPCWAKNVVTRSKSVSSQPVILSETEQDSLYEISWVESDFYRMDEASVKEDQWIVFTDQSELSIQLVKWMKLHCRKVTVFQLGERYSKIAEDRFILSNKMLQEVPECADKELRQIFSSCTGIVYLWGMNGELQKRNLHDSLSSYMQNSIEPVSQLVTALSSDKQRHFPKIWLVTGSVLPVIDKPIESHSLLQHLLWGLGKSLSIEHPQYWGRVIDLDPAEDVQQMSLTLFNELYHPCAEEQVGFYNGKRFVPRIKVSEAGNDRSLISLPVDGSILITGGLGDIGLQVAKRLVIRGARRIILLSRTSLPPRSEWKEAKTGSTLEKKLRSIKEIERLGASVHLASVDVTKREELKQFIDAYRNEDWPPIKGVLHAAGVVKEESIANLTGKSFYEVLAPKVAGGWFLHELLNHEQLDFFVLFSSISTVLQSPFLAAYAAANSFLDGLASYRRALGLPVLSINWGPWAEAGMVARDKRFGRVDTGLKGIDSDQGCNILESLMGQKVTNQIVMNMDWTKWFSTYAHMIGSPLFSLIEESKRTAANVKTGKEIRKVMELDENARNDFLKKYLVTQTMCLLKLDESEMNINRPLQQYGFDSIMAVKLKNRIGQDFNIDLPLTGFFNEVSIAKVVEAIVAELESTTSKDQLGNQNRTLQNSSNSNVLIPVEEQELYEMSRAQRRIWFMYQSSRKNRFGEVFTIQIDGKLQYEALLLAVKKVVQRHAILRATIAEKNGDFYIRTHGEIELPLREYDLLGTEEKIQEKEIGSVILQERMKPFDLEKDPFFRIILCKLAQEKQLLIINAHHIIYDGWTIQIFMDELLKAYQSERDGTTDEGAKLPVQYVDFAHWQNRRLERGELDHQKKYWLNQLAGHYSLPQLEPDYSGLEIPEDIDPLDTCEIVFDPDSTENLRDFTRKHGSTTYVTLLSGLAICLSVLTRNDDIPIGTALSGRTHPELENMIGLFINPVVIRTDLSGNPSFLQALERVKQTSFEAYTHQEYPFDLLQQELRKRRSQPLYSIVFLGHNVRDTKFETDDLKLSIISSERDLNENIDELRSFMKEIMLDSEDDGFDLILSLYEEEERTVINCKYNHFRYRKESVYSFLQKLQSTLLQLISKPHLRISQLLLEETEDLEELFAD